MKNHILTGVCALIVLLVAHPLSAAYIYEYYYTSLKGDLPIQPTDQDLIQQESISNWVESGGFHYFVTPPGGAKDPIWFHNSTGPGNFGDSGGWEEPPYNKADGSFVLQDQEFYPETDPAIDLGYLFDTPTDISNIVVFGGCNDGRQFMYFDVDVSFDGGATFTNIIHMPTGTPGAASPPATAAVNDHTRDYLAAIVYGAGGVPLAENVDVMHVKIYKVTDGSYSFFVDPFDGIAPKAWVAPEAREIDINTPEYIDRSNATFYSYCFTSDVANLMPQPTDTDLLQAGGVTGIVESGGFLTGLGSLDTFANSTGEGDYGSGYGGTSGSILSEPDEEATPSITVRYQFDEPQIISNIVVFGGWTNARQFLHFDVEFSEPDDSSFAPLIRAASGAPSNIAVTVVEPVNQAHLATRIFHGRDKAILERCDALRFTFYMVGAEGEDFFVDALDGVAPTADVSSVVREIDVFGTTAPVLPPIAVFSGSPRGGTVPVDVAFTNLSLNLPKYNHWSFGDGAESTEANPTHTYSNAGSYTVILTVTNAAGMDVLTNADYVLVESDEFRHWHQFADTNITLGFQPTPDDELQRSWESGSATGVIMHGGFIFAFNSITNLTDSRWVGDYGPYDDLVNPYHDPLIISDRGGAPEADPGLILDYYFCSSPIVVTNVTVYGGWHDGRQFLHYDFAVKYDGSNDFQTLIRAATGTPGASSPPATPVDSVNNMNVVSYIYRQTNDTMIAMAENVRAVRFKFYRTGHPSDMFFINALDGAPPMAEAGSVVHEIDINGAPSELPPVAPTAYFSGAPRRGLAPLQVAFTNESINKPIQWLWDFGDGTTSTQENPDVTYANPGRYTITLIVTNAMGSNTLVKSAYVKASNPDFFSVRSRATDMSGLAYWPTDNDALQIMVSNGTATATILEGGFYPALGSLDSYTDSTNYGDYGLADFAGSGGSILMDNTTGSEDEPSQVLSLSFDNPIALSNILIYGGANDQRGCVHADLEVTHPGSSERVFLTRLLSATFTDGWAPVGQDNDNIVVAAAHYDNALGEVMATNVDSVVLTFYKVGTPGPPAALVDALDDGPPYAAAGPVVREIDMNADVEIVPEPGLFLFAALVAVCGSAFRRP